MEMNLEFWMMALLALGMLGARMQRQAVAVRAEARIIRRARDPRA